MGFELALCLMLAVGVVVGMLGGGGSLLTVPLLVYGLGMTTKAAIVTGLMVVGATSLLAAVGHARHGRVAWRSCLIYACAANPAAYFGGIVSQQLADELLMVLFACFMLLASFSLSSWPRKLFRRKPVEGPQVGPPSRPPVWAWIAVAAPVGFLSGLLGAGGGFLVIPALVTVLGLRLRDAIGSTLVIVGLQCLAGLHGHLDGADIDLGTTCMLGAAMVVGSLIGVSCCRKIPASALRRGFSQLLALCGILVLYSEWARWSGSTGGLFLALLCWM